MPIYICRGRRDATFGSTMPLRVDLLGAPSLSSRRTGDVGERRQERDRTDERERPCESHGLHQEGTDDGAAQHGGYGSDTTPPARVASTRQRRVGAESGKRQREHGGG